MLKDDPPFESVVLTGVREEKMLALYEELAKDCDVRAIITEVIEATLALDPTDWPDQDGDA